MGYSVSLASKADREALIQNGLKAPSGYQEFFDFRDARYELPVVRVDIGALVYRLENFRTFTEQRKYILNNNSPSNFFQIGQEVESVQQVQHDILANLARTGKGASVVPIIEVLAAEKQREPLLITDGGVVVNGNRRLAGMRELYAEDSTSFGEFSHVDCMVLPGDATGNDILDVEANLQGKPETRLDYDWIGDAQLLAALARRHGDEKVAARRMRRGVREVKNVLKALAEADLYLKEWAQSEGAYSFVNENGEQFFKDLPQLVENKEADLADASRVIAWVLFDNREKLSGRVYDFNPAIGRLATDVIAKVTEELQIEGVDSSGYADADDFAVDIEDGSPSYGPFIDFIKGQRDSEELIDTLVEVCQGAIEVEKGQRSGEAALKAIGQAHAKLVSIDLTRANPETYAPIGKQLDSISQELDKLRKRLDQLTEESD